MKAKIWIIILALLTQQKEYTIQQPQYKELRSVELELKFKNLSRKDVYKEYFSYFYNVIISNELHKNFSIDDTTLTNIVITIAISESSNMYGEPFKNRLFVKHNNPFGIKGNDVKYKTYEVYDGEKISIIDGFQHFNSLKEAINRLLKILNYNRYKDVRNSKTAEEFFNNLYLNGYFTNPEWSKTLLTIYNKNKYYEKTD